MGRTSKPTQKATNSSATALSPAKGDNAGKPPAKARGSPLKGRKPKKEIKCVKDPAGWYLALEFHEGNLITICVTQSDRRQDAFMQGLIEQITGNAAPGGDAEIMELGLVDGFRMRISLENPGPLLNARNTFQRKVIVGVLDSDQEPTDETFLGILQAIQRWLQRPENNRFGTRVFIPTGWNLTPPDPAPLVRSYCVILLIASN